MKLTEPTNFQLPKKKLIKEKEAPPDQRKFVVVPIRACKDMNLTLGMLRALMLICSYMNRSGITWVSQKKMAQDLEVSQQAISRHLVKLVKAGYLEVLRKPSPGERSTTWRVIFDPSIKAEDAIAITSAIEDTRPPYMKEQQMNEQVDRQGQIKVAQMITKALKPINQPKEYSMPKEGDTLTVKKMKEGMKKAKPKAQSKGTPVQPPEVVPQTSVQIQPNEPVSTTSSGSTEHKNTDIRDVLKVDISKELFVQLRDAGMSVDEINDNATILLDVYKAEGLKLPAPDKLAQEIIQLSKVKV